jgi:hypothetical protein
VTSISPAKIYSLLCIYNIFTYKGRIPKVSLCCIDSSSLCTDRPGALWFFLGKVLKHLRPLESSFVPHGPTPSDLALLSVINPNPTWSPKSFSITSNSLRFRGQLSVSEGVSDLRSWERNIVTLQTKSAWMLPWIGSTILKASLVLIGLMEALLSSINHTDDHTSPRCPSPTMSLHTVLPRRTRLGSPRSSLSSTDLVLEHSAYQYFLFCSAGTEFYPTMDTVPWKLSSAFRTAFTKGIFKNLPTFSESLNWNLRSCKKIRLVPRAGFPKVWAPPRSTHNSAMHWQQERTQVVGAAHDALPFLNLHTLAGVLSYPTWLSFLTPGTNRLPRMGWPEKA